MFEYVKAIYVDDEKMCQDSALLEVSEGEARGLAKHILARLEETLSNRSCDPDTDPATIEHVLPENPASAWEETFPSDRWERGAYRLGNLTLLEGGLNREVGNEEYSTKLATYRASRYALTAQIPEIAPEQWSE